MRLPQKITPDRIRESVVQVFFTSETPFEPLVGLVYLHLKALGFAYTNRPNQKAPGQLNLSLPVTIEISMSQHFFFDSQFKIQLQNGSLLFNCIGDYPGWSEYFKTISRVLSALQENELLRYSNRFGIRYISEFRDIDITEKINFKLDFKGMPEPPNSGTYKMEWLNAPLKVVVNLGIKVALPALLGTFAKQSEFISLIDIDVINEKANNESLDTLLSDIDTAHTKEKQVFFSLLTEEFIKTLDPVYA